MYGTWTRLAAGAALAAALWTAWAYGAGRRGGGVKPGATAFTPAPGTPTGRVETATFGAGCFWCVEAVFKEVKGVREVESGYAGGRTADATYEEVCAGTTGHAEVIRVTFDPGIVSYDELLEVFWLTHDPTTKDRQGADAGSQYRSAVFYHSPEQRRLAESYRKQLDASGAWEGPIVTEIVPVSNYARAEEEHQDYYALNPAAPYCLFGIRPKLAKFRKVFAAKLKATPKG